MNPKKIMVCTNCRKEMEKNNATCSVCGGSSFCELQPINTSGILDLHSKKTSSGSSSNSFWISGMRAFALITFFVIILGGIIMSVEFWEDTPFLGFGIVIGSFVLAFLSVGFIMIFLDMASDISEIKTILKNNKQK